jgi:hypothetical protein
MVDNLSVLDQMHELQILVNKLCDFTIKIPESFQVGAIIAKLPPSWNNYRNKLLHMTKDLTLEQIGKHLRIEVESRIRDGIQFDTNVNVNNVHSENTRTQNYLKVNKKRTNFKKNNSKDPNKDKKNKLCFNCGKKGHYICKCKFLKNKKKGNGSNSNMANAVEEIIAMVIEMRIGMITEVNIAATTNSSD